MSDALTDKVSVARVQAVRAEWDDLWLRFIVLASLSTVQAFDSFEEQFLQLARVDFSLLQVSQPHDVVYYDAAGTAEPTIKFTWNERREV